MTTQRAEMSKSLLVEHLESEYYSIDWVQAKILMRSSGLKRKFREVVEIKKICNLLIEQQLLSLWGIMEHNDVAYEPNSDRYAYYDFRHTYLFRLLRRCRIRAIEKLKSPECRNPVKTMEAQIESLIHVLSTLRRVIPVDVSLS